MSTQYEVTQILLGELILQSNQFEARGKERALQQLNAKLQRAAGMSSDEVVKMLQKSYGHVAQEGDYIEKATNDPKPGPMKKLPLVDALARISVELVEASKVTGMMLRCLRCGAMWRPDGYEGGDLMRPAGKLWMRCPAGCNASAAWLWDEGKPPSYNPLAEYRQP